MADGGDDDRREAADRLRRHKPDILRRWADRVRDEVPAAGRKPTGVILNSIPKLLDQLADSLAVGDAPPTSPPAAALEHADQRADQPDYSLDQVVYEYHLLRRVVVVDALEETAPLPRVGRVAVNDGIDAAIQVAADEYVARQQDALRQSEERFRLLVSGVREYAIFMLDPAGRVATWNAGAERIKGYAADEIVGRHLAAFYTPEDRAAGRPERGLAVAVAAAAGVYRDEGWRVRKDGRRFWADVVLTALRAGGRLRGFAKVTRDATERRALEDALRQRVEQLAAADRAKDEFLAMLSHELRNPLAPVLTAAHVVRQVAADSPVLRQSAAIIDRQVRHMARLVDDLLDVARVTRGAVRLKPERVDLGELARRAADAARPLADERGHRLAVATPPDPVWLDVDPVRVEQALVNRLNNAAKYTDPGGHIWLTAGDAAVVSVRDTGTGIPADLLPRIFDVFAQGARPLDRSHGGLGIGLSLARSLVELHGGTIAAHSDGPGKGSEFVVRLPLTAAAHRPDVVFLDLGLPGMDGFEVARRLREQHTAGRLLVAVTGYGHESDRQRTREAGFDHHLVKPVDPDKIHELLAVLADRG